MHEQNERDLMFEVKLVCDLQCSILPFTACKAQKVYRHLIGGNLLRVANLVFVSPNHTSLSSTFQP